MARHWIRDAAALTGAALAGRQVLRRTMEADFHGKVALVTGGSRGLGLLLARDLLREGCRVAITAREGDELDEAQRMLSAEGGEVVAVPCNISDQAEVDALVQEVSRRLGPVDILINNAGIITVGPLADMTAADFQASMDIMFWGVLYPTLAVLPSMQRRGQGWIVNVTSIGGKISAPHLVPYSSAKFAAVGLSEGLRAELAGSGISVTTIVPGFMRTGSYLNALFKGDSSTEFTWFSLVANMPGITMDAERAAQQIIEAAKRGDAEKVLTTPTVLAVRFHGLFPGLTADLAGMTARFMPAPSRNTTAIPGRRAERQTDSQMLRVLTWLGRSAAKRFNE